MKRKGRQNTPQFPPSVRGQTEQPSDLLEKLPCQLDRFPRLFLGGEPCWKRPRDCIRLARRQVVVVQGVPQIAPQVNEPSLRNHLQKLGYGVDARGSPATPFSDHRLQGLLDALLRVEAGL